MKKLILPVLLALVGFLGIALVFGIVTVVQAQDNAPENTPDPQPWLGQRGGRMGGRMMNSGTGIMQEYMESALANGLGISVAELEERHTKGETFWEISQEKGFTQEEAAQLMLDARSAALNQMVEEGVITQEQADWMKQRSGGMMGGRGAGGCWEGQASPQDGMRGRWSLDN